MKRAVANGSGSVGPFARPDHVLQVPVLPKTRSGKIMRRLLRKIACGDTTDLGDVSTMTDTSVVDKLILAVRENNTTQHGVS